MTVSLPPATEDDVVALLGVPIDNVTLEEAVDRILEMTTRFRQDKRPRLVATVNVDFLVNSLSWFSPTPRHPELLDILRRADLVTADGMPLVWASRLLGTPLKGRVTGADLVPALAEAAAGRGIRLYFLGGQGDTGQRAAETLQRRHSGLQVAGVDSPYVHTVGQALADASQTDSPVVERINRAGADILLIGFGNPKQEVWFHRNRQRLNVPVSIGVGGTFAFITGDVARAPRWMQRSGLEWIFRISQDPWRLWKRYGVGFFKFGLMLMPALAYDRIWRLWQRRRRGLPPVAGEMPKRPETARIALPAAFDAAAVRQTAWTELKGERPLAPLILDFGKTTFIDSTAIGYLLGLWRRFEAAGQPLWLAGAGAAVRGAMRVTRALDLFGPRMVAGSFEVPAAADGSAAQRLTVSVDRKKDRVELTFSGVLDIREAPALTADWAAVTVGDGHCIGHMAGLTFIDSAGMMVLLRLFKQTGRNDRRFVICAPGPALRRMLRVTKLERLFVTAPEPAAAVARLER